ncbi:hypothetical protein PR048_019908 [Dryococelus australis]|uniref:DDE-1 domain-containing protein n=1 Tax=Dryococelus australis TaxID=614101 RepID=A0ABQ9H4S9_9NEOP|nr:hypothetical protein PR048_019908 [Dryococelus australis]
MVGERGLRVQATPLQCVMSYEERETVSSIVTKEIDMARHYNCSSWYGKKTAARQFDVRVISLKRRVFGKNINANSHLKNLGKKELVSYILALENRMYGLTTLDTRCFSYQLAERNGIAHNFPTRIKLQGKTGFGVSAYNTHNCLSDCPISLAMGFNKPVVTKFFALLREEYNYYNNPPHRIFNVYETSLNNVPGEKNSKFSRITSAYCGSSASAVMCASASGGFIPSMLNFRHQKFERELEDGALAGTIFACNEKGWTKLCVFEKWFDHFLAHTKPTADDRVLLLLDGHLSHTKNLNVIIKARENFVTIICHPPHISLKLQPLDVGVMCPLSHRY